jgi:hypothetical protein
MGVLLLLFLLPSLRLKTRALTLICSGVDCINAYANFPLTIRPTYVRIDDAFIDWYHSPYGKEVDRSLGLPVLKALQGLPEAVSLRGSASARSVHERSIY